MLPAVADCDPVGGDAVVLGVLPVFDVLVATAVGTLPLPLDPAGKDGGGPDAVADVALGGGGTGGRDEDEEEGVEDVVGAVDAAVVAVDDGAAAAALLDAGAAVDVDGRELLLGLLVMLTLAMPAVTAAFDPPRSLRLRLP